VQSIRRSLRPTWSWKRKRERPRKLTGRPPSWCRNQIPSPPRHKRLHRRGSRRATSKLGTVRPGCGSMGIGTTATDNTPGSTGTASRCESTTCSSILAGTSIGTSGGSSPATTGRAVRSLASGTIDRGIGSRPTLTRTTAAVEASRCPGALRGAPRLRAPCRHLACPASPAYRGIPRRSSIGRRLERHGPSRWGEQARVRC